MNATERAVVDELPLPLPLTGPAVHADLLMVAMILESELGIRLTDAEIDSKYLASRDRILCLLGRHGIS